MGINASLGGVDTLACDIGGESGPEWDVQRFRIALPLEGKAYEIDLCKDHRGALEEILSKARVKPDKAKPRTPLVPQPPHDGPRRLRAK